MLKALKVFLKATVTKETVDASKLACCKKQF